MTKQIGPRSKTHLSAIIQDSGKDSAIMITIWLLQLI